MVAQSDASVPARGVILIGSSNSEVPGETWGIGHVSADTWGIVRYAAGTWTVGTIYEAKEHEPLSGFAPLESPLGGDMTPTGAGALLGNVSEGEEGPSREALLVRSAGKSFHEVPAPPTTLIGSEEKLFAKSSRRPLLAALDEGGGTAGALVVPVNTSSTGTENGVLHWDGHEWTREEIEIPGATKTGFRVLAVAASSPTDAWLLGQLPTGGVELFRRLLASKTTWKPVISKSGGSAGEALTVDEAPFAVPGEGEPPTAKTQILTVDPGQGVWLDGERTDLHTAVTMFFKPEGALNGKVAASWCNGSSGSSACNETLPESLPGGSYRSFAWAEGGPYGQRVITGEPEGVSLRLEGTKFGRQLALGSESGTQGAAFSSPTEGWLGEPALPVHITTSPAASRLAPYPVPFRYALLAVAPQPEAPVGSLSSQALAVGDNGEVARYAPGEGWQPESLLGPGGRHETPRLRAVAWPTATRAYAVGELGQMWLWRGETGLWEPDPAAPRNFRGDLLGIAFDPSNPQRGYAVGQQGVLLRYGKSWTQDALPPQVSGASFTSIAFAGSEAIVAYRVPHPQSGSEGAYYTGGLLVNDGSGWHIDESAASALAPSEGVPWAVAGLPDGGAALSGEGRRHSEPIVLERGGPGQPWQATPVPYPGLEAPGSLALLRENGTLRVVGSGTIPNTRLEDFFEPPAPSGFPENLIKPYPPTSGHVLRQTAAGWSDEEHGRIEPSTPPGGYAHWDFPYEPDPTAAVLIDPTGAAGWAVGGAIETEQGGLLDTADIARYPNDGVAPPGVGASSVAGAKAGEALLAIGGNAGCAAPCANRAFTGLGPDTWLVTALEQVNAIPGVGAFLNIGPRVTTGQTLTGKVVRAVPYGLEFERYAELMRGSTVPTYPVAAEPEAAGGECLFEGAFNAIKFESSCSSQSAYYAFVSGGVRVIVLDESTTVEAAQLTWLERELAEAAANGQPAIAVGSADLNAQVAAHDGAGTAVAAALAKGGASAYFYNSPEHNVHGTLQIGTQSLPTFGTGTLGYVLAQNQARQDFTGHSGFLLAQVNIAAGPHEGRWPVSVRLIPNIGELAMEARDGVLLRRSQAALFAGLARRPRAGCLSEGSAARCTTSPYIPIPANCVGPACSSDILPEYTFSSSREDFGDFVQPNLASADPRAVLLGPDDKPIHDPASGLFCAYNAGTTVVTISAGGLSASLPVTIQPGSVRRPCGTVPLKELPAQPSAGVPAPAPAPAPTPAGTPPTSGQPPLTVLAPPPVPVVPPAVTPPPAPAPKPQPTINFFVPPALAAALPAFVPPPVPTPARPTPPTGTSAVTSPVEVAEKEEEFEEAPESVSNQAMAYHPHEDEPMPLYILGAIVLAAFAGASARRRPRRDRRELRVAPATVSTMRAQRRAERAASRDVNRW